MWSPAKTQNTARHHYLFMKTRYGIILLLLVQGLCACSTSPHSPQQDVVVSASHSVYLEDGVLKILEDGERAVLYLYVRPEQPAGWVIAGGEGGNQPSPWLHRITLHWAAGDKSGWFAEDAPRKTFSCLFDSRNWTLTMDSGTWAVNEHGFIVVALDENWYPGKVKTGIESLRLFDVPAETRRHLLTEARKQYNRRSPD